MMRADHIGYLWPWKLHVAHNLIAQNAVICNLAELLRMQRRLFAEERLINVHVTDIVQITRSSQADNRGCIHSEPSSDGHGIGSHSRRVAAPAGVLSVDGQRKCLERLVLQFIQSCD